MECMDIPRQTLFLPAKHSLSMINWLKKVEKEKFVVGRYNRTFDFVSETLPPPAKLLDLGTPNALGNFLQEKGFEVTNTAGEDFDLKPEIVALDGFDAVTVFEVLEHLVNPMGVLSEIRAPRLYATIPMRLWFSSAYRSKTDPWDRHYHEFEDWQFDWLLEKSGWKILRRAKWTSPSIVPGIRPLLRSFTPRHYAIEAVRV